MIKRFQLEYLLTVNRCDQQGARSLRTAHVARPVAEREESCLIKAHFQKARLVAQTVERQSELCRAQALASWTVAQPGAETPRVGLSKRSREDKCSERADERRQRDRLFHGFGLLRSDQFVSIACCAAV